MSSKLTFLNEPKFHEETCRAMPEKHIFFKKPWINSILKLLQSFV